MAERIRFRKLYLTKVLATGKLLNIEFFKVSTLGPRLFNVQRLPAANYYHKVLHLGCCSSPRSASDVFLCDLFLSITL